MGEFDCSIIIPVDLKSSEKWKSELIPDVIIKDPDGWNRENFNFSFYQEKITKDEFIRRILKSTLAGMTPEVIKQYFSLINVGTAKEKHIKLEVFKK